MIGKIIAGSSFAGTVGYVMKEQSRILAAEGVTPPNVREIERSECCVCESDVRSSDSALYRF